MADLEELAFKRDRRFLYRLILVLLVGIVGGLMVFGWLTGEDVASCAASSFGGGVTQTPPSE